MSHTGPDAGPGTDPSRPVAAGTEPAPAKYPPWTCGCASSGF